MASKNQLGSGEVAIYDPGQILGRVESAGDTGDSIPNKLLSNPGLGSYGWGQLFFVGGSTVFQRLGMTETTIGTLQLLTPNNDNFLGSLARLGIRSGALNNAVARITAQTPLASSGVYTRGKNGFGGFKFITRFSFANTRPGYKFWAGMTSVLSPGGATEPSATINSLMIGKDSGDVNFQVMNNNAAGIAEKIDTGIPFPLVNESPEGDQEVFEVSVFVIPPAHGVAFISLRRLNPGKELSFSIGVSGNKLPAVTQGLQFMLQLGNGATLTDAYLLWIGGVLLQSNPTKMP